MVTHNRNRASARAVSIPINTELRDLIGTVADPGTVTVIDVVGAVL